jgi:hypothetical protein
MSVATMLHALKSLAVFKVLAGFYFVSLFVQVLYYSRIQQLPPQSSEDAIPAFALSYLRSYASEDQRKQPLPMERIDAITQDLSMRITGKDDGARRAVSNVDITLSSDRTLTIEQQQRRRKQEANSGSDLTFGLERIKTDDWHHLEDYEEVDTSPELPALVELQPPAGGADSKPSVDDRRIVYFLHIRNSAGASMCYAARANGMATPPYQCNPHHASELDSLDGQRPSNEIESYNFVSNPGPMPDAMDKKRYRYVIMLRNSEDRYRSHWKSVVFHNPDQFSFPEWWQRQPDNWNVRALCGARCWQVPKFQLTRELFQSALDRLNDFDSVLLAEEFNATFAAFANEVGWTRMPVPASPLAHSAQSQSHNLPYAPFKWSWDPYMSPLDDALYERAAAIVHGDRNHQLSDASSRAVNDYFAKGPARRCLTPCCHDTCSPTE